MHNDFPYNIPVTKTSLIRPKNTSKIAYLGNTHTEEVSIGQSDPYNTINHQKVLFDRAIDQHITTQSTKLLIEDYKLSRKLGQDPHQTILFNKISNNQQLAFQHMEQYKEVLKDKRKLLDEKKAISDKCTAKTTDYFITITVPRDRDEQFIDYIEKKLLNLVCMKSQKYYLCIEWQKPQTGDGLHAHILLPKGDKQPTDVKKCINNSYKTFFKFDTITDVQIKYSHVQNLTGYDMVWSYIHGDKTEDKMFKVNQCIELREKYGIPDVYTNPAFEY